MVTTVAVGGNLTEKVFILFPECSTHGHRYDVTIVDSFRGILDNHGCGNAAVILMIVIKGEFVGDPEPDEQGDGHAGSEACDIEEGIPFVPGKMTPGDAEIVFEHGWLRFRFRGEDNAGVLRVCNAIVWLRFLGRSLSVFDTYIVRFIKNGCFPLMGCEKKYSNLRLENNTTT
jgi:hypothetical protein